MPTDTPAAPLSGDSSASLTATTLSTDLSQTQLIANGVSFDYSGVPVLRNIDLTLSAGDVLGLVGDNGAGKSTLMWVLSGRRKPTSGVVTHVGQRVLGSQELEAPFDSTGEMLIKEALGPSLRRLQAFEEATEALADAETDEEVARANERYSTIFSD
ncbi:MAG: ATP-binding cassette domain-containing protein, partial [Corynebacterium kroppenstedtii]|nr:ATP-binding cassette domain-containing protein [Corynebacterium kroppenstedtii]